MYELTNLIENIRTALAYSESVPPTRLAVYARRYADECAKVNTRLQQCLPHLRNGNIAEAVRLAEASPNIAEMFNLLNFENRQEWTEVCDGLGLDVPPPLAVEVFQELNDAYLQMVPLEPLLKWHRLHALNGSPIRDRLAVLRSLAKADPMNLFWQTVQETFEKARIKELGREVANSLAQKDSLRLQELYREMTAPGWIVAPPPEYRLNICTAVLEEHADEFMQHFAAFNYPGASAAYQAMQQILYANQMAMPVAIEKNIRAAVQWLQDTANSQHFLAQFQEETAKLRDALDGYTPRQTLENLYYALQNTAVQANRIIPQDLDSHYHNRMAYLSRVERNRYGIVITIFAGSILLVAATIVYALMEGSFAEQVAHALATLETIESESRIDDIDLSLQRIKPNVAQSPKIAPVITRLQGMLEKDNDRAKEFERYRMQAELLIEQKPDLDGLRAARSSVDQADRLKRTPQEITLYSDLKSKYDRMFSQLQLETDREFSGQFVAYSQEFNDLPRAANAQFSPDELVDELQVLSANVQNLLSQFPNISDRQKQEGNTLLTSIANRQQSIRQTVTETEGFRQMLSRIRDLPSLERELRNFSTRSPGHPATDDIKNVLDDFSALQVAAEALQELCRNYTTATSDYRRGDYAGLQRTAAELKTRCDVAANQITTIETVFTPAEHVSTLTTVKPIDGSTFRLTESLLKEIARRELYPWIDGENWYYLTRNPLTDAGGIATGRHEYITAFGSSPKPHTLNANNLARNQGNYALLQSKFAGTALLQLDKFTADADAQRDALDIIGGLLVQMNEASGLDPVLKVVLLHSFISEYSAVDAFFADTFQRTARLIQDENLDLATNWMDVESKTVATQRQRAGVLLNRIGNLQPLIDRVKTETNEFRQTVAEATPKFEFAGLLIREDRRWVFSPTVALPSGTGTLIVLQKSGDQVQPVQVGTVRSGAVTLANNINASQCSPVFFMN
ncbi:MAG: hypothetical protein FWE95_02030 [Planctomycetaceae bacterium]|nr:hypothetical protein [Planctomycetaceae bacterium]